MDLITNRWIPLIFNDNVVLKIVFFLLAVARLTSLSLFTSNTHPRLSRHAPNLANVMMSLSSINSALFVLVLLCQMLPFDTIKTLQTLFLRLPMFHVMMLAFSACELAVNVSALDIVNAREYSVKQGRKNRNILSTNIALSLLSALMFAYIVGMGFSSDMIPNQTYYPQFLRRARIPSFRRSFQ